MANEYAQQLTQETTPVPSDRILITDNATQRLRTIERGLNHGLVLSSQSGQATVEAETGILYVILTTSGQPTTTFNLPDNPTAGEVISVYYSSQNAGSDTVDIHPDSTDTINGKNADIQLFVADDTTGLHDFVTLQAGGATSWVIIEDGRIAHAAKMKPSSDSTTNSASTWTVVAHDTIVWSVPGGGAGSSFFADTTNQRFNILRDGYYNLTIPARPKNSVTDANWYGIKARKNGTTDLPGSQTRTAATTGVVFAIAVGPVKLSAGDYVEAYFACEEANKGYDVDWSGGEGTRMSITEIR